MVPILKNLGSKLNLCVCVYVLTGSKASGQPSCTAIVYCDKKQLTFPLGNNTLCPYPLIGSLKKSDEFIYVFTGHFLSGAACCCQAPNWSWIHGVCNSPVIITSLTPGSLSGSVQSPGCDLETYMACVQAV